MTDEELMRIAIQEAQKSTELLKCGVVIAKDGEVIAKDFNKQHSENNATAHAEILSIGKAGKVFQNKNLMGCTIYCTCEPCSMCLSAIVFAKIERLIFGLPLFEVSPKEKRINISSAELLERSPNSPMVIDKFLIDECKTLLS